MKTNFKRITAMMILTALLCGCSVIEIEQRPDAAFKEEAGAVKKQAKVAVKKPVLEARKESEAIFENKPGERALRQETLRKERQKAKIEKPAPVKDSLVKESIVSEAVLPPQLDIEDPDAPQGILEEIVYRGLKTGMYLFTWSGLIKKDEDRR